MRRLHTDSHQIVIFAVCSMPLHLVQFDFIQFGDGDGTANSDSISNSNNVNMEKCTLWRVNRQFWTFFKSFYRRQVLLSKIDDLSIRITWYTVTFKIYCPKFIAQVAYKLLGEVIFAIEKLANLLEINWLAVIQMKR